MVCEWVGAILAEEEGSLDVEAKVARRIQWEVRADAFIAKTQHMERCRSSEKVQGCHGGRSSACELVLDMGRVGEGGIAIAVGYWNYGER